MKPLPLLALTACALVGLACGSDAAPQAAEDTVPSVVTDPALPATDPPSIDPPSTAPPSTDAPAVDADLPERPVEIDDGAFATIAEMAAAADLVVVATVTDEISLGRPQAADDPSADEFLGLTLSVDSVLQGAPITEVRLGWDAYAVDSSGQRVAVNVMNGISVPHTGDQLLLFVRQVDPMFAELLDGFPTHASVALDGIAFLDDGVVSITDSSALDAASLLGKTVEQVAAVL